MIPVLGFATYNRHDLAEELIASIDYPVEHLVIINNSGTQLWQPTKPDLVKHLWHIEVPYGLGLTGAWNLIVKATPYAPYWLLVNDDATFEPGSLTTIAEQANPEGLGFLRIAPLWSAIVLGQTIVAEAGLYDERFYPLYFDDDDYERRIKEKNLLIYNIDAGIQHHNSASINPERNATSYHNNALLHEAKTTSNDNTWGWSLQARRDNRWD
jgi:GT2 family glycosyltransferase